MPYNTLFYRSKPPFFWTPKVPRDPGDADEGLFNGGATSDWSLGAWHDGETNGVKNWPGVVSLHEQRLVFARTADEPQTMWLSVTADFEDFASTNDVSEVLDDSAIRYSFDSNQLNAIQWISPGRVMLVGTDAGEWQVKAASNLNEPITPTNFQATEQDNRGSKPGVLPVKIGNAVLFVQRGGEKVRELYYDFQADSFVSRDMTVFSEDILRDRSGVTETAYQQNSEGIVWLVCGNGQLVALTYNREQEIVAWAYHELGTFDGGGYAQVESVAVVPSPDGDKDHVYMVAYRSSGGLGNYRRTIEYFEVDHEPSLKSNMRFLDCHSVYSGVAVSSVSGLQRFGTEDGVRRTENEYHVTGNMSIDTHGVGTLANSSERVVVGYPYESIVETMPPEGGSRFGSSATKIKRIDTMTVRVLNSLALEYGLSNKQNEIVAVDFWDLTDQAVVANESAPLFSGDIQLDPIVDWSSYDSLIIKVTEEAYPLVILALLLKLRTEDE